MLRRIPQPTPTKHTTNSQVLAGASLLAAVLQAGVLLARGRGHLPADQATAVPVQCRVIGGVEAKHAQAAGETAEHRVGGNRREHAFKYVHRARARAALSLSLWTAAPATVPEAPAHRRQPENSARCHRGKQTPAPNRKAA